MNQPQVAILILVLSVAGWMSRTDAPDPAEPVVTVSALPTSNSTAAALVSASDATVPHDLDVPLAATAATPDPVAATAAAAPALDGGLRLRADPTLAPRPLLALPATAAPLAASVVPPVAGATDAASPATVVAPAAIAPVDPAVGSAGTGSASAVAAPASAPVVAPGPAAVPVPAPRRADDDPLRKAAAATTVRRDIGGSRASVARPTVAETRRVGAAATRHPARRSTHAVAFGGPGKRDLLPVAYRFSCMYC